MSDAFEPAIVVIADARCARHEGGELRLGRDHRDHAGRRVAPEQCALRTAQNLDAVERPELGQRNAGTRAVNAVDIGRDRAFEAGLSPTVPIPRMRATAAPPSDVVEDTSRDGDKLGELREGRWLRYSAAYPAVTALTAIGTSDSAWLRRVAVMMMLPVSTGCCSLRLIVDGGVLAVALGRRGVVWSCRVGRLVLGLRKCRRGTATSACREQPRGLAHHSLSPIGRGPPAGGEANPDQ